MRNIPFSYPDNDEAAYLDWFAPQFASVFVALNPFIKVPGGEPQNDGDWIPKDILHRAKRSGLECAVTWSQIASLCGLKTLGEVNQALRLTGSRRLVPEFSSPTNTATLRRCLQVNKIYVPDEGYPTPPFEWSLGAFARASGQDFLLARDGFGEANLLLVSDLVDPEQLNEFREFAATDRSFYVVIHTDHHYWLVCQTSKSLEQARPEIFFEGFYADASTNDLWGLQRIETSE